MRSTTAPRSSTRIKPTATRMGAATSVALALAMSACGESPEVEADAGADGGAKADEGADADANGDAGGGVDVEADGDAGTSLDAHAEGDASESVDVVGDVAAGDPLAACLGESMPLAFARELPYATVGVGGAEGAFLVDWGTTFSTIDPSGFSPFSPTPVPGTTDQWDDFSFFGPWARVVLPVRDYSAFADPIRQAGILGTDFLALHPYMVDWTARRLGRLDPGCPGEVLAAAGLTALSTAGYYARDLSTLAPGVPNVPTVPVRIGRAEAPAQIDTGYDDALAGPALNINRAFRDRVAPDDLVRAPELDLVLTTCVPGVVEPVLAHRLADGVAVELVAEDGVAARREPGAIVFVKDTPAAANVCGGIGTWPDPAAQLGVSFMARAGRVVFDPVRSFVWISRQ